MGSRLVICVGIEDGHTLMLGVGFIDRVEVGTRLGMCVGIEDGIFVLCFDVDS